MITKNKKMIDEDKPTLKLTTLERKPKVKPKENTKTSRA